MAEPVEDISMQLRRINNVETISREIAMKLAEMVFSYNYGDDVLKNQFPLIVSDLGEKWEIRGSNIAPSSPELSDPIGGQLIMIVTKTDGKIVRLTREMVSMR